MTTLLEDQKMLQHEIYDEMKNSYIDYAMSVIVGRALPDVRDGLKPVHRRILFGMDELGVTPDKPHKKSARIVGEVMGKYHPHGDSSIYDAMVRLAQPFNIRYRLVDGHGNFGSVDGYQAAAMRYTEARMTPFALEMLREIDKDTVDFIPNFDGEEKEPTVLPCRFPNLLVNGSNGIAVGMATSIPPHNLGEVIDAAVKMIEDKECTNEDLIKIVKGPDFPTGGIIMGKNKLLKAVVAAAAIGSVCYAFRDKIKASTAYQKLDEKIDVDDKVSKVNEKVAKVKDSIMEKMPVKDETDRDYFSLDDYVAEPDPEDIAAEEAKAEEDTEPADIISEDTDTKDNASEDTKTEASPILYENEGLTDTSDDLESIDDTGRMDF